MESVRGDFVAWFNGQEKACKWDALPTYLQRVDTLVGELAELVADLKGSASLRSNAMATCYPGNGAHYVRHCDNTSKVRNGRRLTALYYVNPMWKPEDGGELRLFGPQNAEDPEETRTYTHLCDVAPLSDRVVLFFADERVPHEVLPCFAHRFAITTWFFDKEEKEQANLLKDQGDSEERVREEEERIKREIERFQSTYGGQASVLPPTSAKHQASKSDVEESALLAKEGDEGIKEEHEQVKEGLEVEEGRQDEVQAQGQVRALRDSPTEGKSTDDVWELD
jgi:hypoxia-inducible factor (prolyl hydroxylase)